MPRIVKTADARQGEILDAAGQLFANRGYAATSVREIIDAVGIAKGTFYHHYSSKAELLDAIVGRVADEIFDHVQPIVEDPDLDAATKLVTYFRRIGSYKAAQAGFMVDLLRALELEANARVKMRLMEISTERSAANIEQILDQGVRETVFDCPHPRHTARALLAVFESARSAWTRALVPSDSSAPDRDELLSLMDAQQDAVERLLGATPGSLQLMDPRHVDAFLDAARSRPTNPSSGSTP